MSGRRRSPRPRSDNAIIPRPKRPFWNAGSRLFIAKYALTASGRRVTTTRRRGTAARGARRRERLAEGNNRALWNLNVCIEVDSRNPRAAASPAFSAMALLA